MGAKEISELSLGNRSQIQKIVGAVLKNHFPKIRVLAINIRDREDDDGDQEVEVIIVFDAAKADFNPKNIPSFLTNVIEKLTQASESRFPIVSFVEKSDLGNRAPEAA